MRPLRAAVWGCALLGLAASASPVSAAWCNVFQVCCHRHGRTAASFYAAAPVCDPCPPAPVCTTRYVQRCYYQPVTSYQVRTYYEPVTSYQTSYYYEPVCSYRYSCYFDPCTCSYQQVAIPTTSYRLRAQCNAVQSYVQRCCYVPVTTYQQAFYYEPVTTCCTPTAVAAPAAVPCPPQDAGAVPQPTPSAPAPPAGVTEQGTAPPAGVREQPQQGSGTNQNFFRYYPPTDPPNMPRASNSTQRQLTPRAPGAPVQPAAPVAPAAPPRVRLDRIVSLSGSQIEGQVLRDGGTPVPGASVTFVSMTSQEPQRVVTANARGQFQVQLATGGWLVYLRSSEGKQIFCQKVEVTGTELRPLTLTSR